MPLGKHTKNFISSLLDKQAEQILMASELSGNPSSISKFRSEIESFYNQYLRQTVPGIKIDEIKLPENLSILKIKRFSVASENQAPKPACIFFGGGGCIVNLENAYDGPCSVIAKLSGCDVFRIFTRVAPEYKHDISVCDAINGSNYLISNSVELGIDKYKIGVAGNSSGGNLAANVINANLEKLDWQPAFQVLLSPRTDMTLCTTHNGQFTKEQMQDAMLNLKMQEQYRALYTSKRFNLNDPIHSPLYISNHLCSKMPSTTIICGEFDGLRNDSHAYYNKLKENGTNVNIIVEPGQIHNSMLLFNIMPDGKDPAVIIGETIRSYISIMKNNN